MYIPTWFGASPSGCDWYMLSVGWVYIQNMLSSEWLQRNTYTTVGVKLLAQNQVFGEMV